MYRKLLIANDGSEGAQAALTAAIYLAKRFRARLHMLSVEELPRFPTTVDEIAEEEREASRLFERVIAKAIAQGKQEGVRIESHVAAGHAVPTIVEFIERDGFDLLVIGYMGHSAIYNRAHRQHHRSARGTSAVRRGGREIADAPPPRKIEDAAR